VGIKVPHPQVVGGVLVSANPSLLHLYLNLLEYPHINAIMLVLQALSAATALTAVVHAAAISGGSTGVQLLSQEVKHVEITLEAKNVTSFAVPSIQLSTVNKRASEAIIMAVLTQTGLIAGAACAYGNPLVCGAGLAYAALAGIWSLYYAGRAKVIRAIDTVEMSIHPDYVPTIGCSTGCRLAAASPQGEWTYFANATVNGVLHTLHYYQSWNYLGIRAVSHDAPDSTKVKRQTTIDVDITEEVEKKGNFVGTFYWEDGPEST
jgi:hypothetical protein